MMRNLLILSIVFTAGCSMNPPAKQDPEFVPIRPIVAAAPPQDNGSIYQSGFGISLFSDISAKRVGDLITVVLQENMNAQKSASSSTTKTTGVDLPVPTLLGQPLKVMGRTVDASIDGGSNFSGQGNTSQSNSLTGRVTVTVSEVLPNGYLIVQGEKRLNLNQGSEHVRVSGIIRPADIRSDNTVLSSSVANAQIIYGSTGVLADANTQGWLARAFNSPWWPF